MQEIDLPLVFENQTFLLVTFDDNYADEFDVMGFRIFTTDQWEKWKSAIPEKNSSIYFGTNECTDYSSREEFLETCTVKPITVEYAKVLFDLFGRKIHKCSDWNSSSHRYDTITRMTIVDYGMFPSSLGEREDE